MESHDRYPTKVDYEEEACISSCVSVIDKFYVIISLNILHVQEGL